jgi:hypothetical protein
MKWNGGTFMYKTDICEEISKSLELMLRFNQTQSFDELYDLCKEIDPNITETEI